MSRSNLHLKFKGLSSRKTSSRSGDGELLEQIREVVKERPTYGYRRVAVLVIDQRKKMGYPLVNRKRVYRLMKKNSLLLQKPSLKLIRSHEGKVETLHSNTRWCSDTLVIPCLNGDRVYVAFTIDTCNREVMRYIASTIGIDGKAIRDLILERIEYRIGRLIAALRSNGSAIMGAAIQRKRL